MAEGLASPVGVEEQEGLRSRASAVEVVRLSQALAEEVAHPWTALVVAAVHL